jgi:hypothetical protein
MSSVVAEGQADPAIEKRCHFSFAYFAVLNSLSTQSQESFDHDFDPSYSHRTVDGWYSSGRAAVAEWSLK